jgi:5-methyltetrahydrofolate--homocysteine methyltransferase
MVHKLNNNSKLILSDALTGKIFLMDGATGTYLQNNGLEPGGCPELMNIENPLVIKEMANTYYSNGSDITLTNTFGGNYYRLKHYGLENKVFEINKIAANLAKSAAELHSNKYVFGSIGPTGEFIEPLGDVTENEMYERLLEQMKGLHAGGVDGFLIETQIATEETLLAVKVARENFDLLVLTSLVYDKGPRGYFSMFGLEPDKSLDLLYSAGADVVGANCGNGSDRMLEISKIFRENTNSPLLIQANAGIPIIKKKDIIYPESPDFMVNNYKKLIDLNINFLGGCCGTTESHIKSFFEIIRSHNERI